MTDLSGQNLQRPGSANRGRWTALALAGALLLAACGGGPDVILPGERLDIRAGAEGQTVPAQPPGISLPAAQVRERT